MRSKNEPRFSYGGQALIEGVMIRGRRAVSIAVRNPAGNIVIRSEPLSSLYTGPLRSIPLLRGIVALAETLILGIKALTYSANVAMEEEEETLSFWGIAATLSVSFGLGIGLFFMLPLLAARSMDPIIESDLTSNALEGIIRLTIFLGYLLVIGRIPDIRRVFAYHGAEHMTVHAFEAAGPLDSDHIRSYSTAHPRCGTAFLLIVLLGSILIFALLGRPPLILGIISRVLLVPLIAGAGYEILKFSGSHQDNQLVRLFLYPGLWLQSLTTRQPDHSQIEVAISAMKAALLADQVEGYGGDLNGELTQRHTQEAP